MFKKIFCLRQPSPKTTYLCMTNHWLIAYIWLIIWIVPLSKQRNDEALSMFHANENANSKIFDKLLCKSKYNTWFALDTGRIIQKLFF